MSNSLITFFFQLAEDAYSSYDDFSDLPEASKFIYMVNLIYLVTGIFSALTGSLGILGTYKDSKCILCTSAVLYTIILLTIAALLIFFCTQHPTGSSIDPTVIVCSVWIIMGDDGTPGRGIISLSPRPGMQSLHYYRDRPTFDLFKDPHNEAPHLATPCIMVFSTSMIPP